MGTLSLEEKLKLKYGNTANVVVSYRKLTKKSVLDFGTYNGQTVGKVMELGYDGRMKLAYYYYFCSKITFVDEILDELGITERISKPSNLEKPESHRLFRLWRQETMYNPLKEKDEEKYMHLIVHERAIRRNYRKEKLNDFEDNMKKLSSKARLQWKNQGH